MATMVVQVTLQEWWRQEVLVASVPQVWHLLQYLGSMPRREHQAMLLLPEAFVSFFRPRSFFVIDLFILFRE